jgi:ubiquinol-cytochrome c reductase cytochrome c subunit
MSWSSGARSPAARALGGWLALGAVATWFVATQAPVVAGEPSLPPGTVTQPNAAGQALFEQSCAACHGPQGAGTSNGPDIRNAGVALIDFVLRTGRMPLAAPNLQMQPGQPAFDDAQTSALVDYVASLGSGPSIPNVVTSGADLPAGRNIYLNSCAACHGPAGGGGAVGGGFVAPALTQDDAKTIAEAALTGPGPMPRFSLSPDELRDLTGYVTNLPAEPHPGGLTAPTIGPVTEGFIAGLALVLLLVVARWIGVRQRRPDGRPPPGDANEP